MEEFVRIFTSIDTNNNNEISTKELVEYTKKNNLSDAMVTKWKTLFDPKNTGVITLNNFLNGLGLKMEDYLVYKRNVNLSNAPTRQLPSDVQKISGDMNIDQEIKIIDEVRKHEPKIKAGNLEHTATAIKQYLDKNHLTTWHVTITNHNFASAYTHEANSSFTFRMFGNNFIVWKTQEKY